MPNMGIFDQLGKLFSGNTSESVVGIDIGGSSAKVMQVRRAMPKPILETYGEIALGPYGGAEVGQAVQSLPVPMIVEALKGLFDEAKVTSRDMVFSLPLSSTLLTVIELPDVGAARLAEIVPIEARKYIPMNVSEVSLSHWVIPKAARAYVDPDEEERLKNGPPKVDVLLAAVHNDVLARFSEIAKGLGAVNASFEIEAFSTIRAVMGRESQPVAILDIGAASSKLIIVEEGVVRGAHLLSVGSQEVTSALARAHNVPLIQAEEMKREYGLLGNPNDPAIAEIARLSIERILGEAVRIVRRYSQQKHVSMSRIILSGAGSLIKGLPDVARGGFEVPIVYGDSFARLQTPPQLAQYLGDAGPEFAVALGLALRKLGR
jgi:type IV pilus assembly protein PilM